MCVMAGGQRRLACRAGVTEASLWLATGCRLGSIVERLSAVVIYIRVK